MPRDGSGIYTYPPGTPGIPDTTIESAKYNGYIADIQQDLNLPRPIVAGGTGATNATQARDNLDAERAFQIVTNLDTHIWECGSFYASTAASGTPVAGHAFIGIVYGDPAATLTMEARDITGPTLTHDVYIRTRIAGVWGVWVGGALGNKLTGNLEIEKIGPAIILDRTDNTPAVISGQKINLSRWSLELGNATAEAGANSGSDFTITRYNDAGNGVDVPITIARDTGVATMGAAKVVHSKGTDWGFGQIRFKYDGSLNWDVALNNVFSKIWDTSNSSADGSVNGYQKLGSGIILQWGYVASGVDQNVPFPVAFPTNCLNAQAVTIAPGVPATSLIAPLVSSITPTYVAINHRFANNGGTVGAAGQGFLWFAVGF